jgi:hypothetical protein
VFWQVCLDEGEGRSLMDERCFECLVWKAKGALDLGVKGCGLKRAESEVLLFIRWTSPDCLSHWYNPHNVQFKPQPILYRALP